MPPIAEQLRAARGRRERRWRLTVAALFAVPAALVGARLVIGASAESASAKSAVSTTTSSAPTTTLATTTSVATGLNPGLVRAFARAQAAAAAAGRHLTITSGFRTAAEQAVMFDAEVAKRGSVAAAQRWVFTPDKSMHVKGLAIDVGDGPAADWLADKGARFGLCRTLAWEWWHFEWRGRWEATGVCPAPARAPEDAPPA